MQEKDLERLNQMLEAAKDAMSFIRSKTRSDLDKDRQLTLSLVKSLEMIAHAASKVSKECQLDCEPIPWEEVVDMKQQVVHTYWEIDRDWLWERVTTDLPALVKTLEEVLSSGGN
jgi:uncharacterized protein with HEPN domain